MKLYCLIDEFNGKKKNQKPKCLLMRYLKLISNFVLKSKIASKSKSAINATVTVLETCIPTYTFMYQKIPFMFL